MIAQYDGRPQRFDWAQRFLGRDDRAPYCLGNSQSPQHGARILLGVGGVDLDRRDPRAAGGSAGQAARGGLDRGARPRDAVPLSRRPASRRH
ncbi:MAG: hypothetical protein M5R42_11250 [Rhodocyclaceae bacterium]|nr:hypothetical protein [Rhodocyclaceae bacterium]